MISSTSNSKASPKKYPRPPEWIQRSRKFSDPVKNLQTKLRDAKLVTVCEEAKCPNIEHCFSRPTATFMVLGKTCTRHCSFCSVDGSVVSNRPLPPDPSEPKNLAQSVHTLGLKHVVITMVARDDLPDGGSHHLAKCIEEIRSQNPKTKIEVLTSDFAGNWDALDLVLQSEPDIFNHNLETVESLQLKVRHKGYYDRSLAVLKRADSFRRNNRKLKSIQMVHMGPQSETSMKIKSGLMLGVGETQSEILQTMEDILKAGCELLTIGQYLPPSRKHLELSEYVHPEVFHWYEKEGLKMGFEKVFSGPNVRSSFMADQLL